MNRNNNKIGLYIHVPFCLSKCRYCDFYSIPLEQRVPVLDRDVSSYIEALFKELELNMKSLAAERGGAPGLRSIYLGGGTPTLLGGETLSGIVDRCRSAFPAEQFEPGMEITVEANPDTVKLADLRLLRQAGVNRLSLGVQSFDPETLLKLGRRHTREHSLKAYRIAREAGVDNVSLDLMLGLPGQSWPILRDDLEQVIGLSPEHVSAYLLKLEEGTPLYRDFEKGLLEIPSDDETAEMYLYTVKRLQEAGYHQYEISNFARPGRESRHNLIYWANEEYLGLGPAAHTALRGRDGVMERRANPRDLREYLRRLAGGELPAGSVETVSREWEMAETMFLGLRRTAGIEFADFQRRFGQTIDEVYPGVIERLVSAGLAVRSGKGIQLTAGGMLLSNEVFVAFLP